MREKLLPPILLGVATFIIVGATKIYVPYSPTETRSLVPERMWLSLKMYLLLAMPGVLILALAYWALEKTSVGRGKKIGAFSILTVIALAPFFMQVDIALVMGPAYIALPMLIDGGREHFLGILIGEWPVHLAGLAVVGLGGFLLSSRVLFRQIKGHIQDSARSPD